jgi:hypothetical protein
MSLGSNLIELVPEVDRYSNARSLTGGVGFRRWRAAQQAFGAEVFVEAGPVEAVASTGDLPIFALGGSGVEQAGIPHERHADNAAVAQGDAQGVVGELDSQHALVSC